MTEKPSALDTKFFTHNADVAELRKAIEALLAVEARDPLAPNTVKARTLAHAALNATAG